MSKEKKLIEDLTPEQKAKIPEYVERFLKIGLSTEPTDKVKAEAAIKASYAYINKLNGSVVADPEIVWAESPMQGAKLAAQYNKGDENVTSKEVQDQASEASYGSFEAYWVSMYSFIANELPVEKDELIDIVLEIVKNCGVYWSFEDLVVVTPKPTQIHLKDDKLHNVDGPAILYPNGDCLYAYEGVVKGSLMEIAIANRVGNNTDGTTELE